MYNDSQNDIHKNIAPPKSIEDLLKNKKKVNSY